LFAAPRCIRTSHRQKESKSAASGAVEHLPMVATIGIADVTALSSKECERAVCCVNVAETSD
jgi:hypothetical protein